MYKINNLCECEKNHEKNHEKCPWEKEEKCEKNEKYEKCPWEKKDKDARKCEKKCACELRVEFRKLWSEHAIYTKFYIISVLANIPDANLLAQRLLRNQDDIGNFLECFIGKDKGDKVAKLLKEHILAAAAAIAAVKSGNQGKIDEATDKLFQNSRKVAHFLSSLNPHRLPFRVVLDHFNEHNQFVIDMTVARSKKEFAKDIKLFDAYYAQILDFPDLVLEGVSCI